MPSQDTASSFLAGLNGAQREAACHENGPLLVVAGAGTGKTRALVCRVARLIEIGADPGRILLLTFTRRAAAEMLRRVEGLLRQQSPSAASRRSAPPGLAKIWGGTFHAVAARLLRLHGKAAGLDPAFTIHDRSDSEDLLDVVRAELGLAKTDKRFPKKGTCMAIYSHCVNSGRAIEDVLASDFPWCQDHAADLKGLFRSYVDRKGESGVLDYDDLLLFWHGLLADPKSGQSVRSRFDCVLVDEFQDTNRLQAEILKLLRPDGSGLTAVGDDAQSIYSFRAASVRNILDFPQEFPGTTIVKLQQNYRSTQPILAATNAVIALARQRYAKELWSAEQAGDKPLLVTCEDEDEQAEYIVRQVLAHREEGIDLRKQAVLFRASHHSIVLEAELARRNVPFVKYGGLKFIETAHVKDLLAFLRLAENPRDVVAGTRVLMLLPGIGPKKARHLMNLLVQAGGNFQAWSGMKLPESCRTLWSQLVELMQRLALLGGRELPAQVLAVRTFYAPLLEPKYDHAEPRLRDLEQLEQLASRFADRRGMLAEMALDPPTTAEDFAGPPELDEDYLILSTIHSAKGLEWDAVYVIHASDGNIPSDMATKNEEQIEEELRLFYVALTRAKRSLYVCFPQRYYHAWRGGMSDQYGYAQLTRFIPANVRGCFQCCAAASVHQAIEWPGSEGKALASDVRQKIKSLWG